MTEKLLSGHPRKLIITHLTHSVILNSPDLPPPATRDMNGRAGRSGTRLTPNALALAIKQGYFVAIRRILWKAQSLV
ncbi:MAG: hypothetical protein KKH32_07295, partial [Bacteroidetes bacterium]|nr:hypothetical protein [Bacteroidota bacterium]